MSINLDKKHMLVGINKEHEKKKSIRDGMEHINMEVCIGIECDLCLEFCISDSIFARS